jgi:hypothetical protein
VLAFVILAPIALVTVLGTAMACALAYSVLFKPLIEVPNKKPRAGWHRVTGFLKDITYILPRALRNKVNQFALEHIGVLLRTAGSAATPVTAAINQFEDTQRRIVGTLEDMAEQTFRALWKLNHETIPRKITAALVPIRAQLQRHTGRLDVLEDLNRRVATEVGDTLRALPWGVPGGYVTNIATFLGTYVQLWNHYYDVTRAQLNTLLTDTIPQIRQDISDLSRRLDVQIDARFDALGNRISDLERWRENVVMPRLDALTEGLDALADQIFDPVAGGLIALLERVGEIERQLREDIADRFAQLERGLAELRTDLEEGIRTGLGAFEQRVIALEETLANIVMPRLDAMQLAIDTIAAEIFEEVGAGLTALTARIVAIEDWVFGELGPKLDLALGRIEAIEQQILNDFLPRLRAIEDILAPVAFGAFVLAALRVSAPYLFCENVVRGAKEVCAAPVDVVDDLLLAAFALIAGISIVEFARELQGVTGFVAGAVDAWVIED